LPTQGDVAELIDRKVKQAAPTVVALLIADGLSYYDLPSNTHAEPCFVDGVTTTEFGYRQVVGRPSISRRLFALGYTQQMGFTYFALDTNDLSRDVYDAFSPSQVVRVSAFDEILKTLNEMSLTRSYIQVTLAGLDQISHMHFDRPPRDHYLRQVLHHYGNLITCLSAKHEHVLVVLTADHGILWREDVEDKVEVADDLFIEDIRSPRYIRGSVLRPYTKPWRAEGQSFTLLRAPWMTRSFRHNEWGVHGGISAWESLVPLMIYQS
jgi:hypothetical protein